MGFGQQLYIYVWRRVSLGDVISYYIVAQDIVTVPNTGPTRGREPPVLLPISGLQYAARLPATYTVLQPISGVFHVGIGKDYTTLTAAVNDVNSKGIAGPLTFILDDNTYPSETFPSF